MPPVVLIIDHDKLARERLKVTLDLAGFTTIESDTLTEAARIASTDAVAAIVVSCRSGGPAPLTAVRRMRDDPRTARIPVLVLAPSSSAEDYAQAVEAGADACLGGPLDGPALVRTVQAVLTRSLTPDAGRGTKRLHEQLRQSEKKFNVLFQAIPEPAIITSVADEKITDANPRFSEICGYTREELIGRTAEELGLFANPIDRERLWAKLLDKSTRSDYDVVLRTKFGELHTELLSSAMITVQGHMYLVTILRDIPRRRPPEESIRRQAVFGRLLSSLLSAFVHCHAGQHAQAIQNAMGSLANFFAADHLMIYEFAADAGAWQILREWCAPHVLPIAAEHGGRGFWTDDLLFSDTDVLIDLDHPEPETGYHIDKFRQEGATVILNVPVKGADGVVTGRIGLHRHGSRTSWTDDDASMLRVAGNAINGALAQLRADEAAREHAARFRALADSVPLIIWISGPDKSGTFASKWAGEFAGRPTEELLGNGWNDLVHPNDREWYVAASYAAFDAQEPFSAQARFRRADGEYRWLLITAIPRISNGVYQGHIGIGVDITDLKRAYEQHLAAQKLEGLALMAAGVAHDFNNLLGAIVARAESALAELDPRGEPAEDVEQIRATALRAADIAAQMLTFARHEQSPATTLDLSQLITSMLDLMRSSISKTANLTTDLALDLPKIYANPGEIQQVIINLIFNASEALENKPGDIVITTTVMPDRGAGAVARLEVRDTGCGMTEQVKSRIFDPFFTTRFAGHGLGLSAVQGIVRRHGGSIEVESAPGMGSRFTIFLPTAAPASTNPPSTADSGQPTGRGAVLLIEDEELLRSVVSKLLIRKNFLVIEAADGAAGVEIMRSDPAAISVVILDVTLPGISSLETFDQLLRIKPDVKVVLSTSHTRETITSEFGARAIAGFIQKPYQIDQLERLLRDIAANESP